MSIFLVSAYALTVLALNEKRMYNNRQYMNRIYTDKNKCNQVRSMSILKKIAILDDDKSIIELLEACLKNEDFEVVSFIDSCEALRFLSENLVDGAIIDIMMPNIDGLSLLKKLREQYSYPIILLTAKTEQNDVLNGLYLGADDYVKKPFNVAELVQRLKINLNKQVKNLKEDKIFVYRNLMLNENTHEFFVNDLLLDLTPVEFKIIKLLICNVNEVVSSEHIFEKIWKEKYFERDSNTVSVHIRNIRCKMRELGISKSCIKTIWGVGYKIE